MFEDDGVEPYWNLEAKNMVQGLILHIATDYSTADEDRTLMKLPELLILDADSFDTLLQEMAPNFEANGAVARIASGLSSMPEKQFGSIRATARVSTDFLESPRTGRVLGRTDFNLAELKRARTTVQFFGINDQFTADFVSRIFGEQTILVMSETRISQSRSTFSISEKGRSLMTADEVRRLPVERQIILIQGQLGLVADKLCYYADPEFEGLFDNNQSGT